MNASTAYKRRPSPLDDPAAFSRLDESEDTIFYTRERLVSHLDRVALETVERLMSSLIIGERPAVLDLMAGWESHLPRSLSPRKVVGLGLNAKELSENPALTDFVIHDLNKEPKLPFPDGSFDVVLNTVSIDYMTRPAEVFEEVARILVPGGLFLVVFSNRWFPTKVVKVWRDSSEPKRVELVEELFRAASAFHKTEVFTSIGAARPRDDKYAHLGIPSDPIYAVYAETKGAGAPRQRSVPRLRTPVRLGREELQERKEAARRTLCCPHCGVRMKKWEVPQTPFTEWDSEFMYVCFNDSCPYLVEGWETMSLQGNTGFSYRMVYDPGRRVFFPVAVPNLNIMKDGILE